MFSNSQKSVGILAKTRIVSIVAILAFVFTLTFVLTSCGESTSQNIKSKKLSGLSLTLNGNDAPTVSYSNDAKISVQMASDNSQAMNVVDVLSKGDGKELKDGQNLKIKYLQYSMPGFEQQFSSWHDEDGTRSFPMYANPGDPNDLYQSLKGLKVGAVIAQAIPGQNPPSAGGASEGNDSVYDTSGSTFTLLIMVVSDAQDIPTRANGSPVSAKELTPGLPTVATDDTGRPSITVPDGFVAPTEIVSEQLRVGTGTPISLNDSVSFQFSAWGVNGDLYDSTWSVGRPATIPLSSANEGWQKVLDGAKCGSQYLIIVPASLTGSTNGQTQIFVVDVLEILN